MARPSDLTQVGWIYFIESPNQSAIKVGYATDVYTRLKSLQTGNPDELHLMGKVRATYDAELELHRLLKPHRIRLEWYVDNEVIGSVINSIQDENLDMVVMWLAEHMPHSTDITDTEAASLEVVITAPMMRDIIRAELEELARAA